MMRSLWVVVCAVALLGAPACSDDGGTTDGSIPGDGSKQDAGDGPKIPTDGQPPSDILIPPSDGSSSSSCDDNFPCTQDTVSGGVCKHTVYPGLCLIDGACHKKGQKNGSQCQICDPDKSQTSWTPIIGGCTIGLCYEKGERDASGCQVCDPTKSSTSWTPYSGYACEIGGNCYDNGERDPSGCQVCDPTKSIDEWTTATSDCQIDGKCYLNGDKHLNPTCMTVVCDKATTSSAWTVKGAECLIGNMCYAANTRSANGCQQCIPSQAKTSWSSASFDCELDGKCYLNGDKHPSPTCLSVVCDNTVSNLNWTVKGSECLIDGICRQSGDSTAQGCYACNPSQSKVDWTPAAYDCKIGNTCYTDGDKHPDPVCTSVVCDKATSTTDWTVQGSECFIGNTCYKTGDKASLGCLECNPTLSKTDWSPAAFQCKIGAACYNDGDKHPSPACTSVVCDSAVSGTAWTVKGSECLIGNICYASGVSHPSVTCTVATCNPATSKTEWTVTGNGCLIGNVCYNAGATHPTGCWTCDPTQSKTKWTAAASCSKIVLAALNESHKGNLGGISGANALCASQAAAAGYPGTWKAFLSDSTHNVKDLITGTNATTVPVVNTQGQQMFSYWDYVFLTSYWSSTAYYMYTFDGKTVNSALAYDGDGWTGSLSSGTVATYHCNNWTSDTSPDRGSNGEWDSRYLLKSETTYCSTPLATACVQIP